jgi:uncharacterized protein with von Willebrand factor type A (vWA) domain
VTGAAETLFRGVDVATLAAALARRLREAGLDVGPAAANRFALALSACRPGDVGALYWTAKTTLLSGRADFETFDRVFAAVFGGQGLPIAPWERDRGRATIRTEGSVLRRSVPTDGLAALAARITGPRPDIVDDEPDDGDRPDDDTLIPELLPAELEVLADRPFDLLAPEELDLIGRWLADAVSDLPRRLSRRSQVSARGAIDLRRTLAGARSTGEILTLARRRPRVEPRPLVMVADVSGSMESFTRIYLHLLRAFAESGATPRFEAFTFATTLRRVTTQLRHGDAEAAVARLSDDVVDRFGGTRIATNLGALIAGSRWSNTVRGATVVIASDGWDTDPPELLARRMARLRRMAHRVVWVNPRSAQPGYQPAVAGFAAALPHVDAVCSGHSLRAMGRVIDAICRP